MTAKPLRVSFTGMGRYVYSLFTAIVKMSRTALTLYDGLRLDKAVRSPSVAAARSLRLGRLYARLRHSPWVATTCLAASMLNEVHSSHILLA